MMNTRVLSILALTLGMVLAASGCTTYLETRTPDGVVPPPPATVRIQRAPLPSVPPPTAPATPPAPNMGSAQPSSASNVVVQRKPKQAPIRTEAASLAKFQRAYARVGKPRMVVYFNRKLSDQVMEWRSDQRVVRTRGMHGETTSGGRRNTFDASTYDTMSREHRLQQERRPNPNEKWMWDFEESFSGRLMDQGVHLIDRDTIMRLAAADHGTGNAPGRGPSLPNLEIAALRGKADVLVEVLIARDGASTIGYRFRAVAKEVRTGRVLASTSSLQWESALVKVEQRIEATPQGYQKKEIRTFPSQSTVTKFLAERLMVKLTSAWRGQSGIYKKRGSGAGSATKPQPTQAADPASVRRAKGKGPY